MSAVRDGEPWDGTWPALLGDELLTIEGDAEGGGLIVRAGAKDLYHFTPPNSPDAGYRIKGPWSWQGHWFLEVDGRVIMDGRDLNEELGYEQTFEWQLVAGPPFYFFQKGGKVGVSYAGQVLPQQYDEVIHYKCCSPTMFNVSGNGQMVVYYALCDGTWYYVEAGVYEGVPPPTAMMSPA